MTAPLITAGRLDHVHLYALDRPACAAWYGRVLGLVPYGKWRNDDPAPDHPIFLAPPGQPHSVSLFTGDRPTGGDRTVAFNADAATFLRFAQTLPHDDLLAYDGTPLTVQNHHDYGLAMTFNFLDPAGNQIELVTYDVDAARPALEAL